MVKKTDRRKRDIKTKLMAAICMLMVSCIMVISSTYAWFTLSTAPEVKGINTAVGANGNLEMALLPYGTSVAEALQAINNATGSGNNNAWGNLVDLSDNSIYGLNKITLNPSTLGDITGDGKLPETFLSAPTYGADGRVSGFNSAMLDKVYNVTGGAFSDDGFGVRALGTSSGMSAHELAYRNALVAADTANSKALSTAKSAVSNGGTLLADFAIKKAGGTTTFTADDVAKLITAYGYISDTIDSIEEAIRLYIIADILADGDLTDATYNSALTAMNTMTLDEVIASEYYAKLDDTTKTGVTTIRSALTALEGEVNTNVSGLEGLTSYTWSDIYPYVKGLADTETMKLNGSPIKDYLDGTADINNLVSGEKVLVVNSDGTDTDGIFMKVANFVGSFSTPVVFEEISYSGITLTNVAVTMKINKSNSVEPAHLTVMDGYATNYTGTPFASTTVNIDSYYGFIVDMAFRTNAADSSLLLQTDAIDRIYADNTANPATMGGGSTMTYKADADSGYTKDQLIGLMENIRIVLFNPDDLTIYGYARLDVAEATVSVDGGVTSVTMPIKMWQVGYDADNSGEIDAEEAKLERFAQTADGKADATITKLVQNEATAVSSLVYLDGVNLTNADVGNASITGTMNMQFASSAELKPMEYGDLRKDNSTQTPDANQPIGLTNVTSTEGYPATGAYTNNSIALSIPAADENDTVKVTIGTSEYDATRTVVDTTVTWVVTGITETVEAGTAITVAVTANP